MVFRTRYWSCRTPFANAAHSQKCGALGSWKHHAIGARSKSAHAMHWAASRSSVVGSGHGLEGPITGPSRVRWPVVVIPPALMTLQHREAWWRWQWFLPGEADDLCLAE